MRKLFLSGLFFLANFFCSGAAFADSKNADPLVLVSLPPHAELVRRIAGSYVTVKVMLPAGTSHESYEPTMGQLSGLSKASLYIKLGHPKFLFEKNLVNAMLKSQPGVKVLDLAEGMELDKDDIHYWTSLRMLRRCVAPITAALIELLPDERTTLDANAALLISALDKLDAELTERFAPWRGAAFLVFHPSWGYFARDYSLRQMAIEADGHEPGIAQLQKLVEEARRRRINTVFVEPGTPQESAKYVAEALRAKQVVLDPIGPAWISTVRHAADEIAKSFEEAVQK